MRDVLSDVHVQLKALELIGRLCAQILQRYRNVHDSINRLQQHGQKIHDWTLLNMAHEAVEDMQLLEICVEAAKKHSHAIQAKEKSDL